MVENLLDKFKVYGNIKQNIVNGLPVAIPGNGSDKIL